MIGERERAKRKGWWEREGGGEGDCGVQERRRKAKARARCCEIKGGAGGEKKRQGGKTWRERRGEDVRSRAQRQGEGEWEGEGEMD